MCNLTILLRSASKQRELSLRTLASIPPADFQIFTDGPVGDGIENGGAGMVTSVKMTSYTSGLLPRVPIVFPSRLRRPSSKKPYNDYPPFHHGLQLSSSATVNNWPSTALTQLTRLSPNCCYQRQYSPCQNQS